MRHAFPLLALLAAASTADAGKKPPEAGQFLDKSVVVLPKAVGNYGLMETRYDPAQWAYGVASRWAVNGLREGVLSVFVYPLGRLPEAEAVAQQIAELETHMHATQAQGVYTDLVVGAREPFDVVAPNEGDESVVPKAEPEIAASDEDALGAALLAARPAPNNHGQRQAFGFRQQGTPMRSFAYVFYRNLFAFKVRISVPEDSMDETTFAALADTATRNLVPRVAVHNFGRCGEISVAVPEGKAKKDDDRIRQELLLELARVRNENCASAPARDFAHADEGEERIEIVYPPDTWRRRD